MASEESFRTPVSSSEDLMTMSPTRNRVEDLDSNTDLLGDNEFDSICDITMREVALCDDNLFIDANSLDYLAKCADSKSNQTLLDRGKDSLFVKFDPLYAKTFLANCTQDLSETDIGYETASNNSILTDGAANSRHTSSAGSVNSKCVPDKPTQVVCPVMCTELPKVSPTFAAPIPALVRSVSAILTPTQVGPERLVNISGGTPPMAAPRSPRFNYNPTENFKLQSLSNILQNQDKELSLLRQENKELKYSLRNTKEELGDKIKKLEADIANLTRKENTLVQQLNAKALSTKQMAVVMEEYEKTITSLIAEQEAMAHDKEEALNHLSNMESAFNDLLAKYEKCKVAIYQYKENQKLMEQKISEYEAGLKKYDNLYNTLKQVTTDSLNKANETLEQLNKSHSVEVTKLNANIKKNEIVISSLNETIAQKNRDLEELTRICDQLLNTN